MPPPTTMSTETLPAMLRKVDVQHLLGISYRTATLLLQRQGCPVIRLNGVLRVRRDAFLQWLSDETGAQCRG